MMKIRIALLSLAASLAAGAFVVSRPVRAGDDDEDVLERPRYVNERCEKAIERGCAWLAKRQAHGAGSVSANEGGYGSAYPVAMTSLAGMAWLAHGDTPTKGKYAPNVRKAIEFLLKCSKGTEPK